MAKYDAPFQLRRFLEPRASDMDHRSSFADSTFARAGAKERLLTLPHY
jgi:hypothetical protein